MLTFLNNFELTGQTMETWSLELIFKTNKMLLPWKQPWMDQNAQRFWDVCKMEINAHAMPQNGRMGSRKLDDSPTYLMGTQDQAMSR